MLVTKCVRTMTTMTMRTSTLSIQSRDFMVDHPILHHLLLGEESYNNNNNLRIDLKTLHAYSITSGFITDNFIASRIVQFCLKKSSIDYHHRYPNYAQTIFNSIDEPDVYTWNAMIIGHPHHAISYYFQMRQRSLPPNNYTFALLIKCCIIMLKSSSSIICSASTALLCREIHGQVFKHGVEDLLVVKNSLIQMYTKMGCLTEARLLFENSLDLDNFSWNSMISAFGKNGDIKVARELFDKMPERNLVSWSAMIDGYVEKDEFSEALTLFYQMLTLGGGSVELDVIILVSVLKACANLGALDLGKWVHTYIDRNKLQKNLVLGTSLVDMYAKCGCIDVALELFNDMSTKDVILWNSMIGGLALHGHGRQALHLFNSMKSSGISPNGTTFVTALCACAHVGMVNEGVQIFRSMKEEYSIEPEVEHYGCLSDLLGRAGLVSEAEEVLVNMPMEPQASQLGALLAACRTHNNIEVGERVGKRLISMEPHDGGRYVLLSNIYASAGRWEDARDTRKEMDQMGAKKVTGCSFVEWDGVVHEFVVGDTRHSQSKEIYRMLGDIQREMKMVGLHND